MCQACRQSSEHTDEIAKLKMRLDEIEERLVVLEEDQRKKLNEKKTNNPKTKSVP